MALWALFINRLSKIVVHVWNILVSIWMIFFYSITKFIITSFITMVTDFWIKSCWIHISIGYIWTTSIDIITLKFLFVIEERLFYYLPLVPTLTKGDNDISLSVIVIFSFQMFTDWFRFQTFVECGFTPT